MRKIVVANRILLKPSFQDFDKSKCCHVTDQQFSRVLKNLGIIPPNETVFQLVIRKYFDKGNTREVNYFSFCRDVDRPDDMFPGYTPKKEQPNFNAIIRREGFLLIDGCFSEGFNLTSTKDIKVLENRFSLPAVNIANDPTDVEQRL